MTLLYARCVYEKFLLDTMTNVPHADVQNYQQGCYDILELVFLIYCDTY